MYEEGSMQRTMTELRKWKLDHQRDDIRGWSLRDPEGQLLGTVDELVVDTDAKHVTQVVLGNGQRFLARDVLIGDHELRLTGVSRKLAAEREAEIERQRLAKTKAATPATMAKAAAAKEDSRSAEAALVVPVIEERIRVGKREVDAGGVHVQSKIVTEPIDEQVRLREEHVTLERRRVDQPLTPADVDARLKEGVVELRAMSEQPLIEKRARVVEEVLLKKDSSEHVEHIRDSIRHTEVEVTEISGNGSPGTKRGVEA
jgi:uncharacterized protein (TIGR02271 family)